MSMASGSRTAVQLAFRHGGQSWRNRPGANIGLQQQQQWRHAGVRSISSSMVLHDAASSSSSFSSASSLAPSASSSSSPHSADLVELASHSSDATVSIMAPMTPYMDQLPTLLHLPPSAHAYALSIAIVTIALRTSITLPFTLWQRKRTKRMAEFVVPQWQILKETLPKTVAKRCRREKKSYEEYEKDLRKELKSQIRLLTRKYKCTPSFTLAVPILAHLPLFISLSLLIRTALLVPGSPISMELIPWWSPPADLAHQFEESARMLAERGIEGDSLRMLSSIQGPTLGDFDKTMLGPITLGMLTMGNVELGQWLRRGMTSEEEEKDKIVRESSSSTVETRGNQTIVQVGLAPLRAKILGNILRTAAIAFVVISSQAPAGLLVYWLTSGTYTMVQNSIFAFLDGRRAAAAKASAPPSARPRSSEPATVKVFGRPGPR